MDWRRPFLVLGTLHAGAWAAILAVAPDRVFAVVPPWPRLFAAAVAGEALLFAAAAVRPSRLVLGLALAGKALGPALFAVAAAVGWEEASSWPWTVLNDVIWIPPLAALWRKGGAA